MDLEHCMASLVEKMTTSGRPSLDSRTIKSFKQMCRLSDDYVRHAYHLVMAQLAKDHAEIRLSAFQIIAELFGRSHCFRELLLADFPQFFELTLETDPKRPLPPPKNAAKDLKRSTIEAVQKWQDKFGDDYKKLDLGYSFLKNCKKIDFANVQALSTAERRHMEERQERLELVRRTRVDNAIYEMNDMKDDIRGCLVQIDNCLRLLLPDPNAFDITAITSEHEPEKPTSPPTSSDTTRSQASVNPLENFDHLENEPKLKTTKISTSTPHSDCIDDSLASMQKSKLSGDTDTHQTDFGCGVPSRKLSPKVKSSPRMSMDVASECNSDDGFEEDGSPWSTAARQHGVYSRQCVVSVEVDTSRDITIDETGDNTDIIQTMLDQIALARNMFAPAVKRWLNILTKSVARGDLIKSALDLRSELEMATSKVNQLKIVRLPRCPVATASATRQEAESDEDDFEEVPTKEGYEPVIPEHLREEYGLVEVVPRPPTSVDWNPAVDAKQRRPDEDQQDPASWTATICKLKERFAKEPTSVDAEAGSRMTYVTDAIPSTSKATMEELEKRSELLKRAPIVPYGTDLYYWGDKIETPLMARNDTESHRWWSAPEPEATVNVHAMEEIKSRVINFVGKFEPVKWKCRAPLATGKLCPRMDREKCPFHGKIVARDEMGRTVNADDVDKQESAANSVPEWEDPELQAEILAATGVDLSRKGRKGGKGKAKKTKEPVGLTNIKAVEKNTVHRRLEKKLFNRATLSRVAEALDEIDAKRYKDKFGNNFNYAMKHR